MDDQNKRDNEQKITTALPDEQVNRSQPAATLQQRFFMLILASIVLLADQVTKFIVESTLPLYQTWAPIPELQAIFRFTHVPNTGTAFGLFPNGSFFFATMAIIVSLAIIYYNFAIHEPQMALRVALGLQLGGALGNLLDRFRLGHVTDFLDFGPWPVFNMADMAIVSGAFVLGWLVLREAQAERKEAAQAERRMESTDASDEWSTS